MEVSYYPGCSLHGMAAEYDQSIRAVCRTLDISLAELDDWNCCGASSAHFLEDELAISLPVRNMLIAEQQEQPLLIPCAACFQRLKHADKALQADTSRWTDQSYEGKAPIHHIDDFFDQPDLSLQIKENVQKPLSGLAGVAYYGCLSQRPPKVTDTKSPENPTALDNVMAAIGMDVRPWSYKTDCCGGSLTLTRTDLVRKLSGDLFDAAVEAGAQCIVVVCPMCQSNLDTQQSEIEAERSIQYGLPVFYVTELIALAFGDGQTDKWWNKHFVDPRPLLGGKGLL